MSAPSHAGGVVFRILDSDTLYLLVRAKQDPAHWVFPKGHVERGETAEQAARREVREEAGVDGESIASLGTQSFDSPSGFVDVAYFLMRYLGDVEPEEQREKIWCPFEEALEQLTFEDARELLRVARIRIGG